MAISTDFEGGKCELKTGVSRHDDTRETNSTCDHIQRGCMTSSHCEVCWWNCSLIFIIILATRDCRVEHQWCTHLNSWEWGTWNKNKNFINPKMGKFETAEQKCTLWSKLASKVAGSWPQLGRRTLKRNHSDSFSDRSGYQSERRLELLPLSPSQMYQVETGCILTRRPTAVWRCSRRPNSRLFYILFRRLSIRECRE